MATAINKVPAPSGVGGALKTDMQPFDFSEVDKKERELGAQMKVQQEKLASADAEMKRAELQLESDIIGQKARSAEQQAANIRERSAETKAKMAEFGDPEFHPTEENAQSLAQLFSLVATSGLLLGSSGKMSAMNSLAAMNGMLEGWRQGRADLYKKEVDKFNKETERRRRIREDLRKDLQDFIALSATDREAADLKGEEVVRKAGTSSIIGQYLLKGQAKAALDALESDYKIEQKISERQFKAREEQRKMLQEQRKYEHEQRMARIAEARLRLAEDKASRGEGGKQLPEKQVAQITGLSSLSKSLRELEKEFKPEYASLGFLGFGADLSIEAKRRLGDVEGQKAAQWWSKYNRLQAPNRHALFGATLTGNELKNYQSFTAKPSDDANFVRTQLLDQADYSDATAGERAFAFERSGYRVPQTGAIDFLGTYSGAGGQRGEPAKPTAETVTVGGKTYSKPATMTDEQWTQYKRDVGAK